MIEKIHTDLIDEEGIVAGRQYETFYGVCKSVQQADGGYLRVLVDNDFTDIETRIPYEVLEKAGFKRTATVESEIDTGMDAFDELDSSGDVARITLGISAP